MIDKLVKLKDEELTTRQKTTQCLSSIASKRKILFLTLFYF